MDGRRLDTGQALAAGILDIPVPTIDVPEDREKVEYDVERNYDSREEFVRDAVERGAVVDCAEYYGIPIVWKQEDGIYRGTLLQYRAVTEAPTFIVLDDAVEWFLDTARSVAG